MEICFSDIHGVYFNQNLYELCVLVYLLLCADQAIKAFLFIFVKKSLDIRHRLKGDEDHNNDDDGDDDDKKDEYN